MAHKPLFHVKKRTLLTIAGCIWLLAGFNVARLGILFWFMLFDFFSSFLILNVLYIFQVLEIYNPQHLILNIYSVFILILS